MEQAFLQSILDAPDDDAPRLIFADWLEQHDQADRAELIRVQCALAQSPCFHVHEPGKGLDCASCPLRRMDYELRTEKYSALDWLCKGDIQWDSLCGVLRRGFVEEITVSIQDWIENASKFLDAMPIRVLRLFWAKPGERIILQWDVERLWRILICNDDHVGDNPICRLRTLDLRRLAGDPYHLWSQMKQAYRPWHGLKELLLPRFGPYPQQWYVDQMNRWKKAIPTLEKVTFSLPERA